MHHMRVTRFLDVGHLGRWLEVSVESFFGYETQEAHQTHSGVGSVEVYIRGRIGLCTLGHVGRS